jgi:D-tyrosyl-tRNA(Tyr) deacylase
VRALIQRVSSAAVTVEGERVAAIGAGLLVLLGVHADDEGEHADRLARRVLALRVFDDEGRRLNRSVTDAGGELLCVSQFTLLAHARRGNRPSFEAAAPPERAQPLYERFRHAIGAQGGSFGAHMEVELVNDGPVTLMLEEGASGL